MIVDWSKLDNNVWQAWSMYCEKYSPITKGRGMHRDMLSEEQRAIACLSIKQTLSRASDVLKQHPEYQADNEKWLKSVVGSYRTNKGERLPKSELEQMKEQGRLSQLENMLDRKLNPNKYY